MFEIFKKILKGKNSNINEKTFSEFSTNTMMDFASDTYPLDIASVLKIPEISSTIDMIGDAIAGADLFDTKIIKETKKGLSTKSNKIIENSQWNILLNRKPNSFMSKTEFIKSSISNYFLRGGFYWLINYSEKGVPLELIPLDPDLTKLIVNENNEFVYEYDATLDETSFSNYSGKIFIPYEIVIACHYADLERVTDNSFININSKLIQQLGLKNNYFSLQLNQAPRLLAHVSTQSSLTEKQEEELHEKMGNFFRDAKNAESSAVIITGPKYEVKLLGNDASKISSPVDKDFINALMVNLANAFHIPLPKMNVVNTGQSFYKSREGINVDFYSEAVSPILRKITDKLNRIIYPDNLTNTFIYDYSNLIKFDKSTLGEFLNKMRQNGIFTTNELRKQANLEPIDGGERLFGNGTLMDLDIEKTEEKPKEKEKQKEEVENE